MTFLILFVKLLICQIVSLTLFIGGTCEAEPQLSAFRLKDINITLGSHLFSGHSRMIPAHPYYDWISIRSPKA